MKKIIKFVSVSLLMLVTLLFFFACPNGEGQDIIDTNDGQIIESGTKISDFSGHANSLNWFLGTFSDDNLECDKHIIENTTWSMGFRNPDIPEFSNWQTSAYTIKSITYNANATGWATAGSWTFLLENNTDTITYLVEKKDNNSFYMGDPNDERPSEDGLRRRVK